MCGPVVAAAVILPANFEHQFLNDSKQLNTQMELLSKEENRIKSGSSAREYVSSHTGATKSFLDYIYKNGFN